jgi:hypothetical protein
MNKLGLRDNGLPSALVIVRSMTRFGGEARKAPERVAATTSAASTGRKEKHRC